MTRLIILFQFILFVRCGGQTCKYANEIPYVLLISNKEDLEKICNLYEADRNFFLSQKNAPASDHVEEIVRKLEASKVSPESVKTFVENWKKDAAAHRVLTMARDSMYVEGIACLRNLLEHDIVDYEAYTNQVRERLIGSLDARALGEIKKGVEDYLAFVQTKKKAFYAEESLLYGELGKHIVEYSRLSFEMISRVMTSEYGFGFRGDYKKAMLTIFSENESLLGEYENYKLIEKSIVSKITHEGCFKRLGVLRYYDNLKGERLENAIKINMLMNVFK